jgi:hypothetical protein
LLCGGIGFLGQDTADFAFGQGLGVVLLRGFKCLVVLAEEVDFDLSVLGRGGVFRCDCSGQGSDEACGRVVTVPGKLIGEGDVLIERGVNLNGTDDAEGEKGEGQQGCNADAG